MEIKHKAILKYGMGINYLSNWTYLDAIREIFQNFFDYGEYELIESETYMKNDIEMINITIQNNYKPKDFEFLKIGISNKNETDIGKHGEGLKMALLILLRNDCEASVMFSNYKIIPKIINEKLIGNIFSLFVLNNKIEIDKFIITFEVPKQQWMLFDYIKEEDIIFSNHIGAIVNKPKGNFYVGGLYVSTFDNLSLAYDIKPQFIELDRDRKTPKAFDVTYYTSKIKSKYGKGKLNDLNYSDSEYIEELDEEEYDKIKPIDNNAGGVLFVYNDDETKQTHQIKQQSLISKLYEVKKDEISELLNIEKTTIDAIIDLLNAYVDNYKGTMPNSAVIDITTIIIKLKNIINENNKEK